MKRIQLDENNFITDTHSYVRLSKLDKFKLAVHLHSIIKKMYKISQYKKIKWYHYFTIAPNVIFILSHLELINELTSFHANIYQKEFEKITKLLSEENNITIEESEIFIKSILPKVNQIALKIKEVSTLFKNDLFL